MYRGTTDVEHEMCGYIGNNCSHQNSDKRFKEKYGSHTGKESVDSLHKTAIPWNITRNTESIAV
jgi:hypothetical protein